MVEPISIHTVAPSRSLTLSIPRATTCYLDVSDMSEDQIKELIEICGKKIAQIHIRIREEGLV